MHRWMAVGGSGSRGSGRVFEKDSSPWHASHPLRRVKSDVCERVFVSVFGCVTAAAGGDTWI